MSAVLQSKVYPAAMDRKLRLVRRRQCVLAIGRAVLLGAAALVIAMLLAMLIDGWFTLFSTPVRTLLTVSACGCGAMVMLLAGIQPVASALGLKHAARDVDRATPQLEERWTTVANLVESQHPPGSTIGRAMLRQVTSEAVAMGRLVEPAQVATPKQLQRAVMLSATAATVLAAFLALNWPQHRLLLQRFWFPWADITATQLECVSGDLVVPRGEPVELVVNMSGLPRDSATMLLSREGEKNETVELTRADKDVAQFNYSIAALEASFRYRIQAGDGRTAWHSVTAIDRPALAEVQLTLTAPEYVDRPVYVKDYLPTRIQAIQGSRLRLEMRPQAQLKRFVLRWSHDAGNGEAEEDDETKDQELVLTEDTDGVYRFEAFLEEDVTITPELLSPHELMNKDVQACRIRVIADRPPIAQVISPTEETAVRPNEVVEVKFEAHDDHGIAKAELVVYEESSVNGEPPTILSVEEIPLGNQENSSHVSATAELDIAKYALQAGSNISFAVRVTDNRIAMKDKRRPAKEQSPPAEVRANDTEDGKDYRDPIVDAGTQAGSQQNEESAAPGASEKPDADSLAPDVASTEADSKSPAGKESSADAPNKSNVGTDAKPTAGEVTKSPSEQGSAHERPNAETLAKADPQRSKSDPASPPSAAQMPKRESQPRDGSKPNAEQGLGSDQIAQSDASTASAGSADPDDQPTGEQAPLTPDQVAQASKENQTSDKTTATKDTSSNVGSAASAKSPGSTTNDETLSGVESEATKELPARSGAVDSPLASAEPSESEATASGAPVDALARKDDEMPTTSQNTVSGDLTSAMRRPPQFTDDMPAQSSESNRLRLKIEERLNSAADANSAGETVQMRIRQRLEQIDQELQAAEEVLSPLVTTVSQSGIADPQIQELHGVDQRLAHAEEIIATLRDESKETPCAFAGLHMVEIGTAQITPARDRIFTLIRQPDVDTHSNAAEALHRVSRARELLAELLVRYERVLREERLANAIEETAKFYEVYVANRHRFLRAQTKPNPNPLQRKLGIVEVDQEYLDRLREVTEMRRDLMAEFARMLADDPRLLSKYMDLIKRRQTSLRDRLTELHERQAVISTEVSGWLRVNETQQEDVWMVAAEVRLQDVASLAQAASQLEERTNSQFPLALDPQAKDSAAVIENARHTAVHARTATAKARRLIRDPFDDSIALASDIEDMVFSLSELDAALEQLGFESATEETTDFANKRLAESRALFEQAIGWTELAAYLQARRFHGLAQVDQRQLAFRTELLRIDMASIDQQLNAQFRGEVPEAITKLASELKRWMESITFNQAAATFELQSERLNEAEAQQALALEGFERAEELFDRIRRQVVEELDKNDPQDPNIADLEDPTLDELLAQLEREPDLNALLGLPNRPTNLRVISDFFASAEGDVPVPMVLPQAAEEARQRAKTEEAEARRMRRESGEEDDQTEEAWQQVTDAEQAAEKLQEKIDELKRRADDPNADPEEAEKLRQMAGQLDQMRQQLGGRPIDKRQWEEMVRSNEMQAILRAAARGEPLPDSQWNRLMSSLDEGLWQVRRRTPPEEYRQAIEQYQDRIRKLIQLEAADAGP